MTARICLTRQVPQAGIDLLTAAGAAVAMHPHDRAMAPAQLRQAVAGHKPANLVNPAAWPGRCL